MGTNKGAQYRSPRFMLCINFVSFYQLKRILSNCQDNGSSTPYQRQYIIHTRSGEKISVQNCFKLNLFSKLTTPTKKKKKKKIIIIIIL